MKKKLMCALLCLTMTAAMMTACGGGEDNAGGGADADAGSEEKTEAPADYDPVDFSGSEVFGVSPSGEAAGSS